MKGKLWSVLAIGMLALVFVAPAHAVYHWDINHVGVDPLMAASRNDPIRDQRMLLAKLQVHRADIIDRIHRAQPNWNAMEVYGSMMQAAARGQITFTELPPGTHLPWMAFGVGSGGVQFDTVWDGPGNLPGFGIWFPYQGQEVRMFAPIWCGNLSLITTVNMPPQVMAPPPMQAPPPAYEAPPPPPMVYAPPQQQPYTPTSFGMFYGAPCGGMTSYKIQANQTYVSNVDARSVTQTDASYRAWNNGNSPVSTYAPSTNTSIAKNNGNTWAPTSTYAPTSVNQQSWSNRQNWTNTSTATYQQSQRHGYNPPTQPTTPYCPPGQPAGRAGNSGYGYTQATLAGPASGSALPGTGTQATLTGSSPGSALPGSNGSGNPAIGSALPGNNGSGNPAYSSALPSNGVRTALAGPVSGSALPGNGSGGNPALGSALPGSNNSGGNPALGSALPGRR
jgi:hypothetical protein